MNLRTAASLLAVLLSASAPMLGVEPSFAQGLPIPLPGPLNALLANPSQWLVDTVNEALRQLGQDMIGRVLEFMHWLLGSGNIVTQTPATLSYDNNAVKTMHHAVVLLADAGLAAVAAWSGLNVIIRPWVRVPYHGALEVLPRLLLTAIALNFSLIWGQFAIDLNNALCAGFGAGGLVGTDATTATSSALHPLLDLVAVGIYAIMGMLLFSQMMMRLALLDALLIVGPLAILCWALPQTYGWARLWFTTFFGTVFVQALQVLVLRLGAELITQLPDVVAGKGNPIDAGRAWLLTLILGVAVLQVARKIPRLMPGYGGGAGIAHDTPMTLIRNVQQLLPGRSGGRK